VHITVHKITVLRSRARNSSDISTLILQTIIISQMLSNATKAEECYGNMWPWPLTLKAEIAGSANGLCFCGTQFIVDSKV